MSKSHILSRCFASRTSIFFLISVSIFAAAGTIAATPSTWDSSEDILAIELAPQVDYGIFPERFVEVRSIPEPRGLTPMQTPPPADEGEIADPKPMKPHDRPGIPVDPSYFDQPMACTAPVVDASATLGNEDETFLAVNPTNPQQIVVFSNLDVNSIHRSYTTNGGATWTHGTVATNVACCDAQAAWDSFGNLFLVYINGSVNQINVILSTNGGATFGAPITIGTGNVDQPVIAVGNNSVWVAWDQGSAMVARGAPVTGLGLLGAFNAQQTIPSATGDYGGIAIGPGGKVIVTYTNPTGGQGPATIYTNTDADGLGPGGFGARVTVTTTNVGGFDFIPAQSSRSIDSEPGVVWDATGGPFNNRIYLVYTEEPINESNDTEIEMRMSDNDGATWSAPVRVNDDTTTRSQFLPYVTLDPTSGTVAVGFYDARNDNGTVGAGGTNTTPNDDAEYWATYTRDGGATWAPNVRMSGGWSNAAAAGAGVDYGDYVGQAAYGGKFYAVWSDNANCEGANPNGTLHQFDLVMGTLALPGGSTTPTPTPTPTNSPTNTPTSSPTATPAGTPGISGIVTYGNAIGAPATRFVSNVSIMGAGSPNVMAITGGLGTTEGQYSLTGFGSGGYTVTPSKTGGVNGITSFDAARIAQHAAGINSLVGNQLLVADVSGNGTISSFDAGEVANYVVTSAFPGLTGNWKFLPANKSYSSVTGGITGEDYSALLMGEVSGNWTNSGARPAERSGPEPGSFINITRIVTAADQPVIVPVVARSIANKGIISYEFDVRFDPSVIQPDADPIELEGTLSSRLSLAVNIKEPGLLRAAVYGTTSLDGDGVLMNLRFKPVGMPGAMSTLRWDRIMLNEGDPATVAWDGEVELSSAASNQAEIRGRLLTTLGQGISHALVTMTDTAGKSRMVISNGFGVYSFGDLRVGQTYTISVESKQYAFTPLNMSVTDGIASVDMIAEQ